MLIYKHMEHGIFSVFGNQVRTQLLVCLSQKPKSVTELIKTCHLSQSAVSQHLSKLKQSGLVETKKEGKTVWYRIKYKQAGNIGKMLMNLSKEVV